MQAQDLPDVSLRDPQGHTLAKAAVHIDDTHAAVELKELTLQAGSYKLQFLSGKKCFEGSEPPVAQGSLFHFIPGNPATVRLKSTGSKLNQMVKDRNLLLVLQTESGAGLAACGRVRRWFSPWRNSRR